MRSSPSLCTAFALATALTAQDPGRTTPAAPGGAAATQTAQQQLEGLLAALQRSDAVAIWEWLPESYQQDIEAMLHDLGARIDGKVYERSMQLLLRIAKVAVDKQQFVFGSPLVAAAMPRPEQAEAAKAAYGTAMTLLRQLAGGELRSVDALRTFDGRRFAAKNGKPMIEALFAFSRGQGHDPIAELGRTTVATRKQDERTAMLELRAPGEAPKVETFVRVEGRWLPQELVRDWRRSMASTRQQIAALPVGGDPRLSAQAGLVLGTVEGFVRKFEEVETQAEFDEVCQELMSLAGGRGAGKRAR